MGLCKWLKTLKCSKGVKDDDDDDDEEHRSHKGEVPSSTIPRQNSSTGNSSLPSKGSTIYPNGGLSKKSWPKGLTLTEDIAAQRIQIAFRGYMARKALKRLRAIGRCRGIITTLPSSDEKQAFSTLKHVHFWSRMQAEIKARRLGMVNEGRLQQKKQENKLKLEAKLQELEVEWCGGSETMEEILQRIQQREVAAVKRERAMAYAFSHQWRASSSHYFGQAYYDLGKDSWGWSWKERWIAVRPWETRVQATNSVNSKNMHSREVEKARKTADPAAMRIIVTVKPSLSNRKDSDQARKITNHLVEKEACQET